MTDEEKKAQGLFYEIDEKNKRIIYDPKNNNHGKWDFNIEESAESMSEIAKRTGYEVEATFNGTKFSVNPGMSAEDGVKSYTENCERRYEEYKKSPQYAAEQALLRIEKQKEQKQIAQDDALIANEKLELDYPNVFANSRREAQKCEDNDKSWAGYYTGAIDFAERWAKLMQAEMKKQKTDHLTKKIIQDTEKRADLPYGMSGWSYGYAKRILSGTWSHGEELACLSGDNLHDFFQLRSTARKEEAELVAEKAQTTSATNLKSGKSNDR